jgi:hypothetical protein
MVGRKVFRAESRGPFTVRADIRRFPSTLLGIPIHIYIYEGVFCRLRGGFEGNGMVWKIMQVWDRLHTMGE